ncbi:MAG: hypothetical protein WC750_03020 [Patescibacteria group bacterium]|jgi:hypothetical protein
MRTTISFTLTPTVANKTRRLTRQRGFRTISDYLRFLLEQDDVELITENELVRRSKEVDRLHASNKLVKAGSLKELTG